MPVSSYEYEILHHRMEELEAECDALRPDAELMRRLKKEIKGLDLCSLISSRHHVGSGQLQVLDQLFREIQLQADTENYRPVRL